MHPLAETLLDEPVIAAVKTDDALTAALASPCSTVFLLASTLLNVGELVRRIHAAGKLAVVHIDLVDGLSAREVAVNSLIALCQQENIPYQRFAKHSNTKGGGTIGSIISSHLPMRTADIGVGLLAMHSSREMMGKDDQIGLTHFAKAFFEN